MRTPATLQLRAGGGLGWGREGGGRLESRSRPRVHTWAALKGGRWLRVSTARRVKDETFPFYFPVNSSVVFFVVLHYQPPPPPPDSSSSFFFFFALLALLPPSFSAIVTPRGRRLIRRLPWPVGQQRALRMRSSSMRASSSASFALSASTLLKNSVSSAACQLLVILLDLVDLLLSPHISVIFGHEIVTRLELRLLLLAFSSLVV